MTSTVSCRPVEGPSAVHSLPVYLTLDISLTAWEQAHWLNNGSSFCRFRQAWSGCHALTWTARGRGMCTPTAAPAHGGRWRAPPAPTACPRAQMRPQSCPPAKLSDLKSCLPPRLQKNTFPAFLTGTLTTLRIRGNKDEQCALRKMCLTAAARQVALGARLVAQNEGP